ncbi:MAG: VC0807 family protein [Akkermansiaceae bacterium]
MSNKQQEHPLSNIMWNVLIPIVALSYLGKHGDKMWHIGPVAGMCVAVSLPLVYGVHHLFKTRKPNFFSILGVVSILLTGGIAIMAYKDNGTVDAQAPQWFALKEAAIPFVFGITIFLSHWTKTPLIRVFLYNPEFFDIPSIEKRVGEISAESEYKKLIFSGTVLLAGSFFLSMVMNYFLAMYFLNGNTSSQEDFNDGVAKLTGWGFAVIGVPMLIILLVIMWRFVSGLQKITGMQNDQILLPR